MESSTATPSQHHRAMEEMDVDNVPQERLVKRARNRGAVLARMLYFGDSLASVCAAAIAIAILGLFSWAGLVYVTCATLLWPLAAFSIGLYRSDQLATWASAVAEVPRAFVAILLITWPLYGVASALLLNQVITLTLLTVIGI